MGPRSASVFALVALTLTLAACFQPQPAYVGKWEDEARAHGPMGVAAEMDLQVRDYTLLGPGQVPRMQAPFEIRPEAGTARAGPLVFFYGTVLGVGSGLIVLEGETVHITNGTLKKIPVGSLRSYDDAQGQVLMRLYDETIHDCPQLDIPETQRDIDSAWFFADCVPVAGHDLSVEAVDRALLIEGENVTALVPPIVFDATHQAMDSDSILAAGEVVFQADSFGYGGDTAGGGIEREGAGHLSRPAAVFGRNGSLRSTPEGVASVGSFRMTQALTEAGYALDAEVELRAHEDHVTVAPDNITWVRVDYREKGYLGAAVLENVTVTGPAAAFIRVPLDHPPWLVEELWAAVGDAGWAGPLFALPLAIASPFLVLAEALFKGFDCLLNDCPSDHPYPVWMEPGQVGRFYFQVDATDARPGTYPGTLNFLGANHETISLDVVVEVQ